MINTTVSEIQKGNDPFITVVTGKPVTQLTANKFKPTGGITLPISIHNAVKMPKWIGATPRANATGKYIGTVKTNIATPVRNMDKNSSEAISANKNPVLLKPNSPAHSAIIWGQPIFAR